MHLDAVILLCYKAQNTGIAKATARLCNVILYPLLKLKFWKYIFHLSSQDAFI